MKLVVILPALNEERTVAATVAAIPKTFPGITEVVPVVVNDGSTDRTAEEATGSGAQVVSHPHPKGVGGAFNTGKNHALALGADLVVNIDADGQFNAADIARIVAPIVDGRLDFVTATRFADPTNPPVMPKAKIWGNTAMTRLVNELAGTDLTDVSCGLRAYSQEALIHLNLFGSFTYTQEVILSLALTGLRIGEIPVKVRGVREFGQSRVARNLLRYAVQTSKIIFRTYRDYRPMRFFFGLGTACLTIGTVLGAFLSAHYFQTGQISPHKWAALSAGFFYLMAVQFAMTGIMADMNTRIRSTVEEILVNQRRTELRRHDSQNKK